LRLLERSLGLYSGFLDQFAEAQILRIAASNPQTSFITVMGFTD
jgi:hypothetical protein